MYVYDDFIKNKYLNKNLKDVVNECFGNKSGLTRNEFKDLACKITSYATPSSTAKNCGNSAFDKLNTNNDSVVTKQELFDWLKYNYGIDYENVKNYSFESFVHWIEDIDDGKTPNIPNSQETTSTFLSYVKNFQEIVGVLSNWKN